MASENYAELPGFMHKSNAEKMYQTCGQKLDRVDEEESSKVNKSFKFPNHFVTKDRSELITSQVSTNVHDLVTPTPKLNDKSKLT